MSNESHEHSKHGHGIDRESKKLNLHKDWRAWLAVALMVAAIAMYVLSLDDTIVPR